MPYTPNWSARSSTNKDVSLEHILFADTGGIDTNQELKFGIKRSNFYI